MSVGLSHYVSYVASFVIVIVVNVVDESVRRCQMSLSLSLLILQIYYMKDADKLTWLIYDKIFNERSLRLHFRIHHGHFR